MLGNRPSFFLLKRVVRRIILEFHLRILRKIRRILTIIIITIILYIIIICVPMPTILVNFLRNQHLWIVQLEFGILQKQTTFRQILVINRLFLLKIFILILILIRTPKILAGPEISAIIYLYRIFRIFINIIIILLLLLKKLIHLRRTILNYIHLLFLLSLGVTRLL